MFSKRPYGYDRSDPNAQFDFCSAEWEGQPVGYIFFSFREAYKISAEDVMRDLCIRRNHLHALEAGQHEFLPNGIYGEGFVRSYANYLGLPADHMVKLYRQERVLRPACASLYADSNPLGVVTTVSYSPRLSSLIVFVIAAVLLGSSYFVMAAYTASTAYSHSTPLDSDVSPGESQEIVESAIVNTWDPSHSGPPVTQSSGQSSLDAADEGAANVFNITFEGRVADTFVPSNATIDETIDLQANPDQILVYGISAPPPRPERHDLSPLPIEDINKDHRVVISALGLAYITLIDDRTDQAIFRAEYQRGEIYQVPDEQRVRLMTEHLDQVELIIDGVSYRIPRAVAALNEPLVLDPDVLPLSNVVYPSQDEDF